MMKQYSHQVRTFIIPKDTMGNAIDNLRGGGSRYLCNYWYLSRVNYSYNETYFANVSYRRDASSVSIQITGGDFWSASAAWIISNESFMQDISWINMLKSQVLMVNKEMTISEITMHG